MSDSIFIKKGDTLLHEGEDSTQMYYLVKGTLGVYKRKGDIVSQIGNILEGEVVGEMSFLDKQPRCASVKALVDCELVEIPHSKFEEFFVDGKKVGTADDFNKKSAEQLASERAMTSLGMLGNNGALLPVEDEEE